MCRYSRRTALKRVISLKLIFQVIFFFMKMCSVPESSISKFWANTHPPYNLEVQIMLRFSSIIRIRIIWKVYVSWFSNPYITFCNKMALELNLRPMMFLKTAIYKITTDINFFIWEGSVSPESRPRVPIVLHCLLHSTRRTSSDQRVHQISFN